MSTTSTPHVSGGDAPPGRSASPKVRHRASWIVFVVLGAIVCLGMGAWQLARYQEVTGTVQNLGYTFMWPFLAGFLVYSYLKYIRMEADEAAANEHDPSAARGGIEGAGGSAGIREPDDDDEVRTHSERVHSPGRARRRSTVATEIPADILPTRRTVPAEPPPDEGLRAYNTYLAELARQDGELGDRSEEISHR